MKPIRQLRRSVERNRTRLTDIAIGLILGVVIIPLATLLLRFYAAFSNTALAALCVVQSVLIVTLLFWIFLLHDRLTSREAFIHDKLPGNDVDEEEDFQEGFDLGSKTPDEKK